MTFRTKTSLGLAAGLMLGTALPAAAQDRRADALLGGLGSGQRAGGAVQGLHRRRAASTMNFEFVPWPNFADRMLNELNSGGKLCDLLIGDSQWIGGSAENGYYVKLNDFFDAEGIIDGRLRPGDRLRLFDLAEGHAELLGAAGDGRRQRLVLPQGLVREPRDHGRLQGRSTAATSPCRRPTTSSRRSPSSSRAARSTARPSTAPRSSPSAPPKASPWARPRCSIRSASSTRTRPASYDMEGAVNSADAVKGLEFYKELYECCTPPGYTNTYMEEGLDAFKSGQVAMMMNWFAFMPGMAKDEKVGDEDRLLRQPGREGRRLDARRPGHLGRRQHRQHGRRARIHQMVRPAGRAEEVVVARRLLRQQRRAERPELQGQPALRRRSSSRRWARCRTSGRSRPTPSCCRPCRSGVHDYVVADQGTAQEALDALVEDWTEVFEDEGKLLSCPRAAPYQRGGRYRRVTRCGRDRSGNPIAGGPRRRRRRAGDAAAAWPGGCAACPTGRSPGCSSRRRSSCCWRSTSSR